MLWKSNQIKTKHLWRRDAVTPDCSVPSAQQGASSQRLTEPRGLSRICIYLMDSSQTVSGYLFQKAACFKYGCDKDVTNTSLSAAAAAAAALPCFSSLSTHTDRFFPILHITNHPCKIRDTSNKKTNHSSKLLLFTFMSFQAVTHNICVLLIRSPHTDYIEISWFLFSTLHSDMQLADANMILIMILMLIWYNIMVLII